MKYVASADMMEENSPNIRIMPPLIFFGCLFIGTGVELIVPWNFSLLSTLTGLAVGALISLAGFIFMMRGHNLFKSLGVTVRPVKRASRLVAEGTFRYSRNPMYVGMIAIVAGAAIALDSIWMGMATAILALYLALYVIPKEEAYLEREFGEEYRAYCRSVRRWL